MKICVTSNGDNLDSEVDPRFGRCKYFLIVDADTLTFEAVQNPNTEAMGGAGIQSGQLIAEKGVKAVLTGNVGPNAFQTLQSAGVEIITGATGTIKEAIEKYKSGGLKPAQDQSVGSKFGMPSKEEASAMPSDEERGLSGRGVGRGREQGTIGINRPGAGPGGNCVCPDCGEKVSHKRGVPCNSVDCPKCGVKMTRE